jgi:low affinity Fe/Cu permease
MGRLPVMLQGLARWYASLSLLVFVLFCTVAWPAFAFSNLWQLAQ